MGTHGSRAMKGVGKGDCVPLGEGVPEFELLSEPLGEPLSEPLGVPLGVPLRVLVVLGAELALGVTAAVRVGVGNPAVALRVVCAAPPAAASASSNAASGI